MGVVVVPWGRERLGDEGGEVGEMDEVGGRGRRWGVYLNNQIQFGCST